MVGAILATAPIKARTMRRWAGDMPKNFSNCCAGEGFAKPNPRPMFPNPPGLLRLEPYSAGLRDRIWWGSAPNATAVWGSEVRK